MNNFKYFTVGILTSILLVSINLEANNSFGVSDTRFNEIETRIKDMNYDQLIATRKSLIAEQDNLRMLQDNTQSPAQSKAIGSRLGEIAAELSTIQKVLIGLVGVAAVSALTDDGYNDNVPPVITINGDNPATVELGTTYSDAGASAFDEFHGNTPVTSSDNVDTSTVGSYTVTYTATDLDGNTATATRTVNVVDTTAPAITVTGDNPATVELGTTYTDAGATATDASGTVTVVTSGTVDSDTVGSYTITYTSTDASGNEGTATRTVNVVDTTAPVFTSSSTFVVDEGVTSVGTVTATDLQTVTFTIAGDDRLTITSAGALSFVNPADYEDPARGSAQLLKYDGSTYDITATVTATDASDNAAEQIITVSIRDFGGIDDFQGTGTGTSTSTVTVVTGTQTEVVDTVVVNEDEVVVTLTTGTGTGTSTATGTGTATSTGTGTGTATTTSTSTGTTTGGTPN